MPQVKLIVYLLLAMTVLTASDCAQDQEDQISISTDNDSDGNNDNTASTFTINLDPNDCSVDLGISSDFNNGGGLKEWRNTGESYRVTAELLRRGYSESDIRKIWGDNWLRVFREVTAYASQN